MRFEISAKDAARGAFFGKRPRSLWQQRAEDWHSRPIQVSNFEVIARVHGREMPGHGAHSLPEFPNSCGQEFSQKP